MGMCDATALEPDVCSEANPVLLTGMMQTEPYSLGQSVRALYRGPGCWCHAKTTDVRPGGYVCVDWLDGDPADRFKHVSELRSGLDTDPTGHLKHVSELQSDGVPSE